MISVERKCFRAKVLLPDPEAPIRTTRDKSGNVNFAFTWRSNSQSEKQPSVWARRGRRLLRRSARAKHHSGVLRPRDCTRLETPRGSIRSGGLCGAVFLRAWSRTSHCTHDSASSSRWWPRSEEHTSEL